MLARLEGRETIRVRGTAGTDLTLRVAGRPWLTDALPLGPNDFANYPGGEATSRRTATAPTASSSPT